MDLPTIHYYSNHLPSGRPRGEIHPTLADCLRLSFSANDKVLDIGFSAGHATQFLIDIGCSTSGLYPRGAPADYSARTYPPLQGHLFTGDVLDCLGVPSGEWDGVVCLDVLPHLRPEEMLLAAFTLHALVHDGGKVIVSIPHGDRIHDLHAKRWSDGRLFTEFYRYQIQDLFEHVGLSLANMWVIDTPQNPHYSQSDVFLFRSCPLPEKTDNIYCMLYQEKHTATYKMPLLRALAELAQTCQDEVVPVAPGVIGIPLERVVERWIAYYWPIFASEMFIPQINGEAAGCAMPVVFRSVLTELVHSYADRGGFETFLQEVENQSISDEDRHRLIRASSTISTAIIKGPIQFTRLCFPQGKAFEYLPDDGLVAMNERLWKRMVGLSSWVEGAARLRWAELTSAMANGEIEVCEALSLLTGKTTELEDNVEVTIIMDQPGHTPFLDDVHLILDKLAKQMPLAQYPISILGLSTGTNNALLRRGLRTIADIHTKFQDIVDCNVAQIGAIRVQEIADAIVEFSKNDPELLIPVRMPHGGSRDDTRPHPPKPIPSKKIHRILLLEWLLDIRHTHQAHSLAEYPISRLGISTLSVKTLHRRRITTMEELIPILPLIYHDKFAVLSRADQKDLLARIWFWIISEFPDSSLTPDQKQGDSSSVTDTAPRDFPDEERDIIQSQLARALHHPLMQSYLNPSPTDPYPGASADTIDIGLVLNAFFDQIKPEYRSSIEHLWGIYSGEKHTLQETADVMGVTRERIRQKSARVLRLFVDSHSYYLVGKWLHKTVEDGGGVLSSTKLLDVLRQQLKDSNLHPEFVLRFLMFPELNLERIVPFYPELDAWVSADVDAETIILLTQAYTELLSSVVVSIQWNDLYKQLIIRRGLYTLDEKFSLKILLCLRDAGQVKRADDGGWVNAGRRMNREDMVEAALRRIGHPAHFSEIANVHNELFPEQQRDEHTTHGILQGDRFVRVGQGIYGLPEWGLPDDGSIVQAAERVLRTANHPLTMPELTDGILQTWHVLPTSIAALVGANPRFTRNPDGTYTLAQEIRPRRTRQKHTGPTSSERLLEIMRRIENPIKVNNLVIIHNDLYPDIRITAPAVYVVIHHHPEIFTRPEPGMIALVEWDAHENA